VDQIKFHYIQQWCIGGPINLIPAKLQRVTDLFYDYRRRL